LVVSVLGARGKISDIDAFLRKVAAIEKTDSTAIQLFRADRIFGAEHLVSAAEKAQRSMGNGTNTARTLGMEIMLYAAAERRTSEALSKLGIFAGTEALAMVMVGQADIEAVLGELGLERDDAVLDPAGKDPSVFGIDPGAVNVSDLVLEKVAVSEVFR
jgi:tRNA threonylcarbamoyladenosine modification (KEOPS) complex Cgi121 subunit